MGLQIASHTVSRLCTEPGVASHIKTAFLAIASMPLSLLSFTNSLGDVHMSTPAHRRLPFQLHLLTCRGTHAFQATTLHHYFQFYSSRVTLQLGRNTLCFRQLLSSRSTPLGHVHQSLELATTSRWHNLAHISHRSTPTTPFVLIQLLIHS